MTCSFQQPVIGHALGEVGNGLNACGQSFQSHDFKIPNMAGKSKAQMVAYLNDFASLNAEVLPKLSPKPLRQSHGANHKYGNISWRTNNSSKKQTVCNNLASEPILALSNRSSNSAVDNSNSLQVRGSYDMDPQNEHGNYEGSQQYSSRQYPTTDGIPRRSTGGSKVFYEEMAKRGRSVIVHDGLTYDQNARAVHGDVGDVTDTQDKYYFNTSASGNSFLILGNMSVEAAKVLDPKPVARVQTEPIRRTPQPDTLRRESLPNQVAAGYDLSFVGAPRLQPVQMVDSRGLSFRTLEQQVQDQQAYYPYMSQQFYQGQTIYSTFVDPNFQYGQNVQNPYAQQYYPSEPNFYPRN